MATPMHDKDYEKRKQEAQELIAAGGCSAIKLWSGTDAERLCPKDHIKDVKFDPLEAPVYITEWLDAAKKAVELINRGIFLLQPVSSEPAKESRPDKQWSRESARVAAKEAYKSFAGLPREFDAWSDNAFPPTAQPEPSEEKEDSLHKTEWNSLTESQKNDFINNSLGRTADGNKSMFIHTDKGTVEASEDLNESIGKIETALNTQLSPPSVEKTLGQMLREIREEKGLSENAVRQETGVSNEYLRRLEDDELKSPSASVLWKLSKYYEIDLKPLAIKAGIIIKALPSPPSVKPEREETASGLPSPLLDWVDAEDDLPSDQNEEYHLRYRTSDGWAADCNMVYLSLKEFPGLQWLKETASPLLLAALDKMASSQPSPSALGGQVAASFYCMYNKLTGDCAVQCGHCKSLSSQPSPASPAVQQEDGEVPEEVSQWIVHRSFTSFSHGQPFQQCVGALKDMYHKMQEEIEIRGHQINDLREENKDLQSRLTASRYVTDKTMAQLSEKETEAADYRNALIKIEILGTAVESPGVFESGRGWEATKNKYAEIAWAARVKYIQQTPTK